MANEKIKNAGSKKKSDGVSGGVMLSIAAYFRKYNIAKGFAPSMKLVFDSFCFSATRENLTIDIVGTTERNLKKDIPIMKWIDETDIQLEKSITDYYRDNLFEKIKAKNSGDFSEFYEMLHVGFEDLISRADTTDYPFRLEGKVDLCKKLSNYLKSLSTKCNSDPYPDILFSETLYAVVFFLALGRIYDGIYPKLFALEDDEQIFLQQVVKKYGANSIPGSFAIFSLAEAGNVVALYEAFLIYYYGRFNNTRNFAKAFEYCKKAAINEESINPTSLFDMAYFYYYYHNKDYPLNELFNACIPQIDNDSDIVDIDDQKIQALEYCKKAYEYGCVAATNLLGNILSDRSFSAKKKKMIMGDNVKTPLDYYLEAAKNGYVYAYNNLYKHYKEVADHTEDAKEKEKNFSLAMKYLKMSANAFETWACNRYGLYLYEKGTVEEAYKYFSRGVEIFHPWCSYNLIEKYYIPVYKGEKSFDFLDDSIDYSLLIKVCLNSYEEIAQRTQLLLKDCPELLPE